MNRNGVIGKLQSRKTQPKQATMTADAELLWHINNEYRAYFSQTERYASLLGELLRQYETSLDSQVEVLAHIQQQVKMLSDELRSWRYTYFYESAQTKRMVQTTDAVRMALHHFGKLRDQHAVRLTMLSAQLGSVPRPNPGITRVANDDLWLLLHTALDDLRMFLDELSNYDLG